MGLEASQDSLTRSSRVLKALRLARFAKVFRIIKLSRVDQLVQKARIAIEDYFGIQVFQSILPGIFIPDEFAVELLKGESRKWNSKNNLLQYLTMFNFRWRDTFF